MAAGSAWAVTLPQISVSDGTIAAPASGTAEATFVVTLSEASSTTVTVRYRTADGSATAGDDYQPTTGTLRFAPGESSKTVTVTVNASPVPVAEKVFYLQLFDPSKATIARPQGTATIINDLPAISISDTFIAEPPPGGINRALFTVTLSAPTSRTVRVAFTTANGSAVAGEDYEPESGVLTFRPGQASATVSVVKNDLVSSPDQIFWLKLANPSNGQLARAAGQATIVDSDRIISMNDTAILQPPPGTEAVALFEVVLSEPTSGSTQPAAGFPTSEPASVDFTTADGSAVAGEDYVSVAGTLLFPPGESVETISVPVRNNGVPANDKAFFIKLTNPTNARLARSMGTATIVVSNRTVAIEDTTVTDTDTPGNAANFVVSLSAASPEPITVRYATADGTALAGVDYAASRGTVVFPPGELSTRITIPLLTDVATHTAETPETFFVDLLAADNATIARTRATATIVDTNAFISVGDTSVMADPSADVEAVFSVSLTGDAPTSPIRVIFTTADGTATAPADYQSTTGTVTT